MTTKPNLKTLLAQRNEAVQQMIASHNAPVKVRECEARIKTLSGLIDEACVEPAGNEIQPSRFLANVGSAV